MTIGPAPMIRIDLMSVRLGIALRKSHKKRARLRALPRTALKLSLARERCLDQNRGGGKGWRGISGGRTTSHLRPNLATRVEPDAVLVSEMPSTSQSLHDGHP